MVNHGKALMGGFGLGLLFAAACGSAQYRYYGIAPLPGEILRGTLLGPEPKDDRPLSDCTPDDQEKGKCVVLFTDTWERAQSDYLECRERLKACEDSRL